MRGRRLSRTLASVALSAFALAVVPFSALAQTAPGQPTQPTQPTTTTPGTPARATTPAPSSSTNPSTTNPGAANPRGVSTPAPLNVPGGERTPIPSGTAPPNAPSGAAGGTTAPSGGPAPVNAAAIPTLPPADQTPLLPYPAYGTPSPVTNGATPPPGVPQIITLQQAILIAYGGSPTLAAARAAVEIAAGPVLTARAQALPTVTGSASTTRTLGQNARGANASNSAQNTTFNPDVTSNVFDATLRQLIFDGGRVSALIREARANQNASLQTYQRSLQTVAFNVSTAYYNALSAQRQTQVALATVQLDLVNENLVSAQIRAGTAARADLATAQLQTAQARVSVIRDQATELNNLATLSNTLGLNANIRIQPKDDVGALSVTTGSLSANPAFPTPTFDQALARAYALRPDLAAQQQTVASAQQALRAAKLGYFPTFSGALSYGTSSTDVAGGSFRNSGSGQVSLSIPIFDPGTIRGQIVQAQGQLDQANAQFLVTQQGVQLNVRQALVSLVSAYASLTQANQELTTAQTVLKSTQAQYAAGVTTLPLLLNAQVGITTALTDIVTSVYTVRQAEQSLLFAEGANGAG
jgi:outer membrane protein